MLSIVQISTFSQSRKIDKYNFILSKADTARGEIAASFYIRRNFGLIRCFSSPEPKAPGEFIVKAGSVVRPQFQTTSPLKLLSRLQPNFT